MPFKVFFKFTLALISILIACENQTFDNNQIQRISEKNKKLIEKRTIECFEISLYEGGNEFDDGKIILKNNITNKKFSYLFKDIPLYSRKIDQVLSFVDFDFDNKKEIVIFGDYGLYIFDRITGKPKNIFKALNGPYCIKGSQNYIYTDRGEYIKDLKSKTIKIIGRCGANCGSEQIYEFSKKGMVKLIKDQHWDNNKKLN